MLSAIGELHLSLDTAPEVKQQNAAEMLSGISAYLQDSDGTFTSLADGVNNSEETAIFG